MLYLSKKIVDQLPDPLAWKLSKLSVERQTLFECFYYRMSKETLNKPLMLHILYETIKETDIVQ